MSVFTQLAYLAASIFFIVGIKMLGKTSTARKGNMYSSIGMLIAIVVTLLHADVVSYVEIFVVILIGSAIGLYTARKVEMTSMPEMVAIFNGLGGGASVLVAASDYWRNVSEPGAVPDTIPAVAVVLSILIGCVTLTGSLVAYGKLSGKVSGSPINFAGQHALNLIIFIVHHNIGLLGCGAARASSRL